MISAPLHAHERCYRDYSDDSYYYGYRDTVRYERPHYRSYYHEDRPVILHREILVDDGCDSSHYYRHHHHHHNGIRIFFGF